MKVIVLTTESEKLSAEKLGYETHTHYHGVKSQHKGTVVIRWGNGFSEAASDNFIFDDTLDFPNVLNSIDSIQNNVKKHEALQILNKAVNTPKIFKGKVPAKVTAVFRPTQHAGGANFQLKKGPFNIPNGYYATEFIKTDKEVRVFVCGNRTITCSREKGKQSDSDVCRSNWAYRNFRETPKKLHSMALKASKALKLDICAFDILVKGNNYYFLEGNTAPTIEGEVRQFFKDGIKVLIKKKFPKIDQYKPEKTVKSKWVDTSLINYYGETRITNKSLETKKTVFAPLHFPVNRNVVMAEKLVSKKDGILSRLAKLFTKKIK